MNPSKPTLPFLLTGLFAVIQIAVFQPQAAQARSPEFKPAQSTQTAQASQTPSSANFAADRLNASPRHHEWVEIPSGKPGQPSQPGQSGQRKVKSFVAYPEKPGNTLAVIILHENRGLTDWTRSFADQIAEAGYLAIAPDMLSDFSADIHRTADFKNEDDAKAGIYKLDPGQVMADLRAVQSYIAQAPASNGKVVVIGFCWGGAQAFTYATEAKDLAATFVFYGSAPEKEKDIRKISAPVYGFYGENDQRINSGIEAVQALMKKHGKTYEYEIYKGAGHAFMKHGDDPEGSPENKKARDEAWARLKKILMTQ